MTRSLVRPLARSVLMATAILLVARLAPAQDQYTAAKKAAQKAVAATNAHTEAEQKPDGQQPTAAPKSETPGTQRPGSRLHVVTADTVSPPPTIMREEYAYSRDGRRDPFFSLMSTNELRPTLSDLKLMGILYDHGGRHSVATLKDIVTNAQYRVTTGSTLGRMHISAIKLMTVVFTIDEFGTTRQDSLILRDTTKVRR